MVISVAAIALVAWASSASAERPWKTVTIPGTPPPQSPPPPGTSEGGLPNISKTIYVNGCWDPPGCTLRRSAVDNAIEDQSRIPVVDDNATVIVSSFARGDEIWDQTIACLREVYEPYNVEILDSRDPNVADPADTLLPHHEAVLAGTPQEVNRPADNAGIAPVDCEPLNNVMSFTFANATFPDGEGGTVQLGVTDLCAIVAQESAHAFSLDHVTDCLDPMTYISGCGQKFFRNRYIPCGEFSERPCRCGGPTQNSHTELLKVFGKGKDPPPPDLAIVSPIDGQTIDDSSPVQVTATDRRLVSQLELYVNGWLYETIEGHGFADRDEGYDIALPSLPDSVLDIEIRAYNDLEIMSSQTIRVTKGAPCTAASACLDGQECDAEGRCIYPPPTGGLGDACERPMDCLSHLCPSNLGESLCSQECRDGFPNDCPEGFECLSASASPVCWPVTDTAGCCSAGAGSGPTPWQIMLLLLCAGALLRRRRTHAHVNMAPVARVSRWWPERKRR